MVDSTDDGEDWREKVGIGGGRLSRGVRDNRFDSQFFDPGRSADFATKFRGRLADYLDPEKLVLRSNAKNMLNA